ncbi:glycine dehydrogenase (aminomethyl-transferring) [Microbulbifer flavimaris]|uniref:Glycine dehydrogenase (decarboxylating) n=1 Tax=Microbulbifer flavimaris TaxID=1781068 RepID=A0ABX4I4V1_9GAMM|nr:MULTISPECIES: aminomethyl-transferring glycine dehydrogenase [Microbulbifer]KUJ84996.1 glycine dehydrogenase (aminomethyl-transferring) [Microbulbifer sp. ZGT114]PCO07088.1 glycine dehydrogenase (aminomethyl-transferring) [Microbulbifer flavimaris]
MLQAKKTIRDLEGRDEFTHRHIGPGERDVVEMLDKLGHSSLADFINEVVPDGIRMSSELALAEGLPEHEALEMLRGLAAQNQTFRSFIGQGYYGTRTPNVVLRNILENPAWYTAYTPYQPEISQGRLEALFNFQTMVSDLTGMDLANASMLDEATAAAEAMTLCQRMSKSRARTFFVDRDCLPQTIRVLQTRAEPLGIELIVGDPSSELEASEVFGALLQYPGASGEVRDYRAVIDTVHEHRGLVAMAADILSLVMLTPPGQLGADVAVGSTQRFGVPMGFGGPHAAYMATRESYKRSLPGRLVGQSVDGAGRAAYRLALQTREQHIRREKATSNICTAQVLLAVMAAMYAVYHGPQGLRMIAGRVHCLTTVLALGLEELGVEVENETWFDTLTVSTPGGAEHVHAAAHRVGMNLRKIDDGRVGISLDETATTTDIENLWRLFDAGCGLDFSEIETRAEPVLPSALVRSGTFLSQQVFSRYQSETEMLRYLRALADRDIALDRSMIPLGSCTMKLNATAEMLPVTWPEFANVHPLAPAEQVTGYATLVSELEAMLCEITGYDAVSLQPNAGSQGEYAGLLAIRAYHASRGEGQRDICLIPSSAHGTNPASAQMCGMRVVVVQCDTNGNVCLDDLREKASEHAERLAAIMVTYPSTHGVFEEGIGEIANIVHRHGGQVYIDGANLNAMVGLCQPGQFGGDVSHLNLHKTFCIPHGGGGPGVGPVAVREHLSEFLPGAVAMEGRVDAQSDRHGPPVSAATAGSASILPITWMYIRMMGREGLPKATELAILNANYIAARLEDSYPILYRGKSGRVAHECIVDLRPLKEVSGISVEDVAKRLIDYGFHAPTMSFPVAGTLMIEPTESESRAELDRFCDAMIQIREEVARVERGEWPVDNNPLVNAPHTAEILTLENWPHPYSRTEAVYPLECLREKKYWPPVGRVDNVYGDKNLVCSCPSIADYIEG